MGWFLNNTGRSVIEGWDRKKKGNSFGDPGHMLPQAAERRGASLLTCPFGLRVLGYELGALGWALPPLQGLRLTERNLPSLGLPFPMGQEKALT